MDIRKRSNMFAIFAVAMMVFAAMTMTMGIVYAEDNQTEVSSIYVSIVRPTAGQAFADATSNVRVSGDGYTVTRIEWCEDYDYDDNNNLIAKQDSDHLGEHGIFNPKYQYRLIIELEALDGYVFPYQSISNPNLLSSNIIHTYIGGITGTRDLSNDRKSARFVLTGINAYTSVNVSRPKTGEEVSPDVSLPEFESSWYSIESAEWCDEAGGNTSPTREFAENEKGYIIAHLVAKEPTYNWYSKPYIRVSGGEYINTLNQTSYDKIDVVMSVRAAAPTTSLGDITIDLTNGGTTLTGNELEAVNASIAELGKLGIVGIPNYQAYDIDNNGAMDVYMDNMWIEDSAASRFYAADECSIESGYTLTIPDSIKETLLAAGNAHCDSIIFITPATVEAVDISDAMVTGIVNKTYTGKAQTQNPTVKVNVNGTDLALEPGTDYTPSYKNNINVGTATVIITGKGSYTGTISKTFKINAKSINPAVNLSKTAFPYNGKVQTPAVTVKYGSKNLVNKTDYTVTYASGRKNVGTYAITVKLKGNYSGSKKVSYKINPKGTSISKLSRAKKAFTVTWKRQSSKMASKYIGGYQVQYSLNKNFKTGNKTVGVAGYKKTSRKVTGLKAGKKYYVRVRTYMKVGNTTLYSPWSAVKAVITAK